MNPSPLTPRDAAIQILEQVRPQPPLRVPLDDALDGVLAEDIISPINLPAWDNSAMDGYAVRSLDTRDATPDAPARLRRLADRDGVVALVGVLLPYHRIGATGDRRASEYSGRAARLDRVGGEGAGRDLLDYAEPGGGVRSRVPGI
ncbi:MAG TPA: hypothetical protein VLK88_02520, partial [Gemmatimonadales bacterium]|nr:hypothetical protein [Gemmatimonadales bacterium]